MNVKENIVDKLQRQFREELKEEQKRLKEQQNFANILPLQFRSLERGPPFSFLVYSFSSQKSFLISKFERAFEEI
jgi:hypothetical protein